MALAWKAGWVNALRGSNPLSSAIDQFQNTLAMTVSPLWALPVIGVSDTASCGEAAPAIARGSNNWWEFAATFFGVLTLGTL